VPDPSSPRRWFRPAGALVGGAAVFGAPALAIAGLVPPLAAVGIVVAAVAAGAGALAATARRRDEAPAPKVAEEPDVAARLDEIDALVAGSVPTAVEARVERITTTLRETLPRLDQLGRGSSMAHSAVQTATSYLPEALGAYLRLPRSFADHRPVSGGKTPLLLLCDQLDLLAAEMDEVFVAVCKADADALVAHGRFLAEKFGAGSGLDLPQVPHS
jgi:hypothetical protein